MLNFIVYQPTYHIVQHRKHISAYETTTSMDYLDSDCSTPGAPQPDTQPSTSTLLPRNQCPAVTVTTPDNLTYWYLNPEDRLLPSPCPKIENQHHTFLHREERRKVPTGANSSTRRRPIDHTSLYPKKYSPEVIRAWERDERRQISNSHGGADRLFDQIRQQQRARIERYVACDNPREQRSRGSCNNNDTSTTSIDNSGEVPESHREEPSRSGMKTGSSAKRLLAIIKEKLAKKYSSASQRRSPCKQLRSMRQRLRSRILGYIDLMDSESDDDYVESSAGNDTWASQRDWIGEYRLPYGRLQPYLPGNLHHHLPLDTDVI
ncbi:hypothetical protein F4808DRAFT_7915 [Astrocystis sublimbata]|nr:hypothetical protein F4808DRAFT_7915 [Astrocystis sublimbata]